MKLRVFRVLALLGLCTLSVPIMGAGNDCPKTCVALDVACTDVCGSPLSGTCKYTGAVWFCDTSDPGDGSGGSGG